ncbi:hypothetical protein CEUSTIGMA_g8121.t1 [Chlamydomonas eustigma]|uniref:Uncharacterized protein n=1 Tax=Chlamydomonas eustigma TaxID=1157962 RepID=A0A250XCA1_9CHLO|nr:hypothetical protein CEUSTIGMA_g8121.t1 [Chlamydomonas eustigma]|eukprot:GAX80686.1 hypothetical protein CEUSTIGMA_g8121.t1 [Chlamydomonas eustigma]
MRNALFLSPAAHHTCHVHDSEQQHSMHGQKQEACLSGAKHEMHAAEKLACVPLHRYAGAAAAYALQLFLLGHYYGCEEVLKLVRSSFDKAKKKSVVTDGDECLCLLRLAIVAKERGMISTLESLLQTCMELFGGSTSDLGHKSVDTELQLAFMTMLVAALTDKGEYTNKAELLCQKVFEIFLAVEEQQPVDWGPQMQASVHLQMARISITQRLFEEAEQHACEALEMAGRHDKMMAGLGTLTASSLFMLAMCGYQSHNDDNKEAAVKVLLKALQMRSSVLGNDHPLTLEVTQFQIQMMIRDRRYTDAELALGGLYNTWIQVYGPNHVSTLQTMGCMADLNRQLKRYKVAEGIEDRIQATALTMLRVRKMDSLKGLAFVTHFLAQRDYMRVKTPSYMARAYVAFRERLGPDAQMTFITRTLEGFVRDDQRDGVDALEVANKSGLEYKFQEAEAAFKQAWSIAKLLRPDETHERIVLGLACALSALN